jgi:hypothetical protein
VDSSGPEVHAALSVVAATTPATPLVLYCKAGKDRTGLVTALALHCCGAGDEVIIADYHRSQPPEEYGVEGTGPAGLGGGKIEAFSSAARGLGIDYSRFHDAPEAGAPRDSRVTRCLLKL